MTPEREIAGIIVAHSALSVTLDGVTDAVVRRPSLLPGWTVGHVLTHIARNADSAVRRLHGAARGEIVDQYAGGAEGRERDIEEGSGRPADELVADVRSTAAAVETAIGEFPDDAWDNLTRGVSGNLAPAYRVVYSRWREVEVHHVDLGLGYSNADWPKTLVEATLPDILEKLPQRCDPAALLAWAIGRGDAPKLESWS